MPNDNVSWITACPISRILTFARARMPVMAAVRPGRSGPVILIRTISFKAPLQSENKVRYSTRKCPDHPSARLLPPAATGYTVTRARSCRQSIDRDHFETHTAFTRQPVLARPCLPAQQASEAARRTDNAGPGSPATDAVADALVRQAAAAT